jgi:hypothetical protein
MKTEKFSGSVSSAYGEPIALQDGSKEVKFNGSFQAYETADEIRAANDWPSDSDVVSYVNAKRKASARAKATESALEAVGISKPDLSDPTYRRKRMIADFVAMGVPQEIATQQVDAILGGVKAGA